MSRFLVLLVFLVVVVGGGFLLGYLFPSGAWYAELNKPIFNPPNEVFVWVWPVLYVLIAIAGWRVFTLQVRGGAWGLWLVNLVLNFLYTPLFFGANLLLVSTVVVGLTLLTAIAFISATWNRERVASVCFIPYALWLGYAFTLALTLWWIN